MEITVSTSKHVMIHEHRKVRLSAALFARLCAILHARYVSTVSGSGANTDRIHCIWAEIQLVQYVLYLIVSEVEADTDCIHRIIQ